MAVRKTPLIKSGIKQYNAPAIPIRDIYRVCSKDCGVAIHVIQAVTDTFLYEIVQAMADGYRVRINRFGSIFPRMIPAKKFTRRCKIKQPDGTTTLGTIDINTKKGFYAVLKCSPWFKAQLNAKLLERCPDGKVLADIHSKFIKQRIDNQRAWTEKMGDWALRIGDSNRERAKDGRARRRVRQ